MILPTRTGIKTYASSRSLILGLLSLLGTIPSEVGAAGKTYKDKDWNSAAQESCGLAVTSGSERSAAWVKVGDDRKMRMILREGEVGKCSTDAKARHGAPYWERSELRQDGYLSLGSAYRVQFETIFLEGFEGNRETFFQLHGWHGNCHAYPPLMMMFDKQKLTVWALAGVSGDGKTGNNRGEHRDVVNNSIPIAAVKGKTSSFVVDFDTRTNPGRLSISLNGKAVVKNAAVDFADCAKPYFKFGVYRPGGKGSKTSSALFDNITVEKLGN